MHYQHVVKNLPLKGTSASPSCGAMADADQALFDACGGLGAQGFTLRILGAQLGTVIVHQSTAGDVHGAAGLHAYGAAIPPSVDRLGLVVDARPVCHRP